MFVRDSGRGYRGTGQIAWGWFLLIFQPHDDEPAATRGAKGELRACVRYVHLAQCGHWMMGRARVGPHMETVSGTYGSDGLPCTAPVGIWERLHPLPPDLQEAFWKGGGHNSGGSEMPLLHKWANEQFSTLHMAGSNAYLRWKESQTHGTTHGTTQRTQEGADADPAWETFKRPRPRRRRRFRS